jgi:hypothetical protein
MRCIRLYLPFWAIGASSQRAERTYNRELELERSSNHYCFLSQLSRLQLVPLNMLIPFTWSASIAVLAVVDAREISFPSVSGFTSDQAVMGAITPDIHQGKFGGLSTYANLPYVHCLAAEGEDVEKFDIAILGAPFDTVSHY